MLAFIIHSSLWIFGIIIGLWIIITIVNAKEGVHFSNYRASKLIVHGSLVVMFTVLLTVSFNFAAESILYNTNCETNLIINPSERFYEGS